MSDKKSALTDAPNSDAAYKELKALLKPRVSKERYKHSVNVSETAMELAQIYGYDVKTARLAGILHDWDKGLSNKEVRQRAIDLGLDMDPMVLDEMPWLLHGPTAAAALEREYPQFGKDVFQAIARHTSGAGDMAPLDCIIYVADIIEPDRTFGDRKGIEQLRMMVGEVSLEELFFYAFKYTLEFLVANDRVLYPATVETWNVLMRKFGHLAKHQVDIWKH